MADATPRMASEDIYRRVFLDASEGLILLDRHRVITEVNPALLALTGRELPDLVGRPETALYTRHPVEFFSASRDHLSFETSLSRRDGREIPVLVTRTNLRDESGAAAGYMVFIIDLTELKATQEELRRAERRYHNMYRNAVQGMFQSRLSGELLRVNPAYARFLGYATTEEMLKLKAGAVELYYDPAERGEILRLLKRRGFLANYEVKLRRKDGTPAWVLANYRLNRDDPGGEPIIEGIMVDNTRQKRLEEELRREHRKLQKLSLRDNLTGLYNTRFLYQALEHGQLQADRGHPRPLERQPGAAGGGAHDPIPHPRTRIRGGLRRGRVRAGAARLRQGPGARQGRSDPPKNAAHDLPLRLL